MQRHHDLRARVEWRGNTGSGTADHAGYARDFSVRVAGKPDLAGSAHPAFRGDPARHDPEDLFLASIGACHMLFFLALCARGGVRVLAYEDEVTGRLVVRDDGGGRFESIALRADVRVAHGADVERAHALHAEAGRLCFIANSCGVAIAHSATVCADTPDLFPGEDT